MADFAEAAILIGQTLLLVLLLLVIYVSIRNGRKVADRQLQVLEAALLGPANEAGLHGAPPELDVGTRKVLVEAVTGVHKGMASRTRLLLAVGIFSIAAMMAMALVFGNVTDEGVISILGQGVTLLFGLLATIVGFYFGGRSAMHASQGAKDVGATAGVVVDEAGRVLGTLGPGGLDDVVGKGKKVAGTVKESLT